MKFKFDECGGCKFFARKRTNPICGECGIGEFYEPRPRKTRLTDDELMMEYGRMHNDD